MIRRGPLPYAIPPHSTNQPIRATQPITQEFSSLPCRPLARNMQVDRLRSELAQAPEAVLLLPKPISGSDAAVERDRVSDTALSEDTLESDPSRNGLGLGLIKVVGAKIKKPVLPDDFPHMLSVTVMVRMR